MFEEDENYLKNKLASPCGLKVYDDGNEVFFAFGSPEFDKAVAVLKNINEYGYEMPALGVSLDRLTKEEMKKGLWVEFLYDEAEEHRDMPFDSLLIKVNAGDCGYNAVRGVGGKYDGRVFYYSLAKGNTMHGFAETLSGLLGK